MRCNGTNVVGRSRRATIGLTAALMVFLLPALLYAQSGRFELEIPESVDPGGVAEISLHSETALEGVTAVLLDGESDLAANHGVRLSREEGRERWVVLLGVASTIRPGTYEVRVRPNPAREHLRREIVVTERGFVQENIPLSVAISELRSSEDPRKREQAIEMISLTNTFNGAATPWNGSFLLPVDSDRRTSRYGDRRRFVYADGGEARSIHNGVDLAAPTGTAVYAPGGGTVVFAEERIVTGNSVVLEHFPGVYGLFYHLDTIDVAVGDMVEPGMRIGTVGSTGVSTGPHLHWELRVGGVSVDPGPFLDTPLVDTAGGIGALSE